MESWSDLCRCCLSSNSEVSILNNEEDLKVAFFEITTIEVKEDDGLPHSLCAGCFTSLNSAYQFREQCINMNKELKSQLDSIIKQTKDDNLPQFSKIETQFKARGDMTVDDIAKESMKQLESMIKIEPNDDDDYYYVLVIDDPNEKEEATKREDNNKTKQVPQLPLTIKHEIEPEDSELSNQEVMSQISQFSNVDSYLVSNPPIPLNVPATILQNEEQDNENHYEMEVDGNEVIEEHELCTTQDDTMVLLDKPLHVLNKSKLSVLDKQPITIVDTSQDKQVPYNYSIALTGKDIDNSDKYIKILTPSGTERAILLKDDDGIKYIDDSQLLKTENADIEHQEIIFCEGEDSQPLQILKCDESDLVIEYAVDGQIATVLQQEDGSFLCDCGEQFDDLNEYEQHQYKHNPAGDLLCNLCGKGFETPEILSGHMVLHRVSSVLVKCLFCSQLVKRNNLTQHIKYVHNSKPQCNICKKTFANQNNLKRHRMIHQGIREFECDICHKRFGQKITMQTHRMTHINPFVCNQCGNVFENKDSLATHKTSDECAQAKQKVNKAKLELMKTVKQEVTSNLGKLLGYACSLCKKMFSLESALEQHIENSHIFEDVSLEDAENRKLTKRFACSICGKGCASQAMLIMHERVHTNERPFPCQLCSLRFKTKTHLRTHQLTHTREKKFGCSVCMKFFALKGNLVVHLRTHTGERPYVCSICNEAFIDSKYLKKHKVKKHAIDNLPWNQYTP